MLLVNLLTLVVISIKASDVPNSNGDEKITCPSGTEVCDDHMTCCLLSGGDYGCCPFPDATCCSDLLHCCPADTTCDIEHGLCRREDGDYFPWLESLDGMKKVLPTEPAFFNVSESENDIIPQSIANHALKSKQTLVCPGGTHTCVDGYTCCPTPSGDYGCCPFEDAICCSDHIHCCPKGSACDVTSGKCSKKHISLSDKSANVVCPGGQFQCPDYTTCCPLAGGEYGCCPLENATCCADKLHCCPKGFKCDGGGICVKSQLSELPWLKTKATNLLATKIN